MPYTCYKCQSSLDIDQGVGAYCRNGCAPYCSKCGSETNYDNHAEAYCCPKVCKATLIWTKPQLMKYPGVAVGVVILDARGRVLLGKRKGELGTGEYSLPGGKLDFGETPFSAAIREVLEETNIELSHLLFTGKITNDYFADKGKQYITLYYLAYARNPESLKVMEPDKIEGWDWYDVSDLPQPMWMHTKMLITSLAIKGEE